MLESWLQVASFSFGMFQEANDWIKAAQRTTSVGVPSVVLLSLQIHVP